MHLKLQSRFLAALGLLTSLFSSFQGLAQIQFDVFLGYDGIAHEASWMPLVCEIKNDGPGFNGIVEVTAANQGDGAITLLPVELPTGTLKRIVIPVFVHSSSYSGWDVKLRGDRGRIRAESLSVQPRKRLSWRVPLAGSIPRTAGGAPVMREVPNKNTDIQPVAARFQTSIFPDNPMVLGGMSMLYLNSEKAPELRSTQAAAIISWMKSGGHLVLGIEQAADAMSTPWLKAVLPCQLGQVITNAQSWKLQHWLRTPPSSRLESSSGFNPYENISPDSGFESAGMLLTGCRLTDGEVIAGDAQMPLIVSAERGRGRITVLLFSPEREPVRSWKNLPSFWARMANVPPEFYASTDNPNLGAWSIDSVISAMIETAQIQTLPVQWLLLLLLAYLLVIGPLDQYWLKRLGKPMLTWVTFPCYVLFFSLLIYGIGYKLRAGESEWNELHFVDVLSAQAKAELRGNTYLSAYSPANETYELTSTHQFGTLRGELSGYGGAQVDDQVKVLQVGDSFKAEVFVPVWASRFYANEWLASGESPLKITASAVADGWQLKAENLTMRTLKNLHVAIEGKIAHITELAPRQVQTWTISRGAGGNGALGTEDVSEFVNRYGSQFQQAVHFRRRSFGSSAVGQVTDVPNATVAISLLGRHSGFPNQGMRFIIPPGLDVSSSVSSRTAVVFAWDPDHSPAQKLYRFTPKRSQQNTLWRVFVPVQQL